jgi:NAD(P)-dependent dehydrogenase (short-subunit alcohol dehydrogenase family)
MLVYKLDTLTIDYFDDPEQISLIKSGLYLDQIGEPEDVSSLVLFLASKKAKNITGSNFTVDGGWTAGKNL